MVLQNIDNAQPHKVQTLRQFAKILAQTAYICQKNMNDLIKIEEPDGILHNLFNFLKSNLIFDLNLENVSKIFIQSIVCSLGAIKIVLNQDFSIQNIPNMFSTSPFLKKMYLKTFLSGTTGLSKIFFEKINVQKIITFLQTINIDRVLSNPKENFTEIDSITQFYELFLYFSNSQDTYQRGLFHTPSSIVSFFVDATDYLLKTEFNYQNGLLDKTVQILDPSAGIGIFLEYLVQKINSIFNTIHNNLSSEQLQSEWIDYVSRSLYSKILGFELLLTPYILAHLKLSLLLKESCYDFSTEQRLNLYLTNTLDVPL